MNSFQRYARYALGTVVLLGGIQINEGMAIAQVIPDMTLGNEASFIVSDVVIKGNRVDRIEGGAIRGPNIFHSFDQFNIRENEQIYFESPVGTNTILSRVTGNDISDILGTLGVDGQADLFFLNPNGIIFGDNAQLDISGSFLASTANSFTFPDGNIFSTTNPQAPPLLTINAPIGLQRGINLTGDLVSSANLQMNGSLTLDGNNLRISGAIQSLENIRLDAQDTVKIIDNLASPTIVSSQGELVLEGRIIDMSSSHPRSQFLAGGNMVLRSDNSINSNIAFGSGGNFRIEQLDGNLGSLISDRGTTIFSLGNVQLGNYEGASLQIFSAGSVDTAGRILINRPSSMRPTQETVTLSNGFFADIDTGEAPTVDIRTGVDPNVLTAQYRQALSNDIPVGDAELLLPSVTSSDINTNHIGLNNSRVGNVLLTNQYEPNKKIEGDIEIGVINTDGGDLFADSRNEITITGGINGRALNSTSILREGGNIFLLANGDITLVPIAQNILSIPTGVFSAGTEGGSITLVSNDGVSLPEGIIGTLLTESAPSTQGGDITIMAQDLLLSGDTTAISTDVVSQGIAGNIILDIGDKILIDGTDTSRPPQILSQVSGTNTIGKTGNIFVNTDSLMLQNGGVIFTLNRGNGDVGDIRVSANTSVDIQGIGLIQGFNLPITSSIRSVALNGNSGDIYIDTQQLNLENGGQIASNALGGDAGNIFVNAETMTLSGDTRADILDLNVLFPSGITTTLLFGETGDGGDITLSVGNLALYDNASLGSSTFGDGDAGNITIIAEGEVLLDRGFINSAVGEGGRGRGGDIDIQGRSLVLRHGGQISSGVAQASNVGSAARGEGGTIRISTSELVDIAGAREEADTFDNPTEEVSNLPNVLVAQLPSISTFSAGGFSSRLSSRTERGAEGRGGDIFVDTNVFRLSDGAVVETSTANGSRAGDIDIAADHFDVIGGAQLITTTSDAGQAGNMILDISDAVTISGRDPTFEMRLQKFGEDNVTNQGPLSGLFANTAINSTGEGGKITITTSGDLDLRDEAIITSRTSGEGNAGVVTIRDANTVRLFNSAAISSTSTDSATGTAGGITIDAGTVTLRNQSEATVSGAGTTVAGNLTITANVISLGNQAVLSAETEDGTGGNIQLQVRNNLQLRNNSAISASTNNGTGSRITLNQNMVPTALVTLGNESAIATVAAASGNGGQIILNVDRLRLNNSEIGASTQSGEGGDIKIPNVGNVQLMNSAIAASAGTGRAGNININASRNIVVSGDRVAPSTGDALIRGILVESRQGEGGDLAVRANRLVMNNGATISASTHSGVAGQVKVTVHDSMQLTGDGTTISAEAIANEGRAGNVTLQTHHLTLENGASIVASNRNQNEESGNIFLQNLEALEVDNASISARTTDGVAGNIVIHAETVALNNNGRISAEADDGTAGNLNIRTSQSVDLANDSVLSVETGVDDDDTDEHKGQARQRSRLSRSPVSRVEEQRDNNIPQAGNLSIETHQLTVEGESSILVNSPSGQAGNLSVTANQINLDNSEIRATTRVNATSEQAAANVNLDILDFVILRNGSLVSAEALEGANGGNITIDAAAGFIIASLNGNNDMVATAIDGNGGSIEIAAQQLIGLRANSGEFTALRNNSTNDMSVTSSLGTDGVIVVNDLGIDPVQGAADLPVDTAPPPLNQGCIPGGGRGNFTHAGQGGVPLGAGDVRGSDRAWEDISPSDRPPAHPLISEAQNWTINDRGQVVLQSEPETNTVQLSCHS